MERANRSGTILSKITFTLEEKRIKCQDDFLDNENNKAHFIAGLSYYLFENGFQCVADADTTIAKIASEYQSPGKHIVVNADDTDILCVLMHHWKKAANPQTHEK